MSRAKTVTHDAPETEAAARPAETGGNAPAGTPEPVAGAASRIATATESLAGSASTRAETGNETSPATATATAAAKTTAAGAETSGETTPAGTEPASTATAAEGLAGAASAGTAEAIPAPAEADETAEAGETDPAEAQPAEPARSRPAWRRLPALLLAAAVLLTGAGVWFTLEARATAANPAAANLALTDVGATADVTSAVTLAMNQIFSYSYDRTDVTEKAAAAVLRGAAKDSYDKLFAEVRRKAPEQKLVLSSRVSAIAVQELQNGHARLLVFLDQSAVRADNNATDSAAAQLSVTAEHTDGHWVVTALEPR